MINEERTKLMTRLALYETKEGKKELQITKYFQGDYVGVQMLWSFVCGTLAFVIVCGLCVLYNIEDLMINLFNMDILYFSKNIMVIYTVFIAVYMGLCYAGLSYRYGKYKKRVNKFLLQLKELYKHYVQAENRNS